MLVKMNDATATIGDGGLQCSAQRHAAGDAQEHDLRPGPGDGATRRDHPENRYSDLLLRPAQPLAARQQRKHQRSDPSVPAQGDGLVGTQPRTVECHYLATEYAPP